MAGLILVPLDGSPLAERALPVAAALARATRGRLRLVRAVGPDGRPGLDESAAQIAAIDDADAYLASRVRVLGQQGVAVETVAAREEPVAAIIEEARLRDAWLIVLATHGHGGLARWVMGSTAAALLARSSVPLLLVRARHARREIERLAGARIVVPLDGSPTAESALPPAERLAEALGGQLVLVPAIPPVELALTPGGMAVARFHSEAAGQRAVARAYLGQTAGQFTARGLRIDSAARIGDPAAIVEAICREYRAALIVMATHGRTGLDRVVLGSVAEAIVR